MPRSGRGPTVAPVPGRTRSIGLGADDERSHQEDRKPSGGTPGSHGGGAEESLPGLAALATAKGRGVDEPRPLGAIKHAHIGVGCSLYAPPLHGEEVGRDEDCRE